MGWDTQGTLERGRAHSASSGFWRLMLQEIRSAFLSNDKHLLKASLEIARKGINLDVRNLEMRPSHASRFELVSGMELSGETQCRYIPSRNSFLWRIQIADREDRNEMFFTFLHELRHVHQQLQQAHNNLQSYCEAEEFYIELGFFVQDGDEAYYSDTAEIDAYAYETAMKLKFLNLSMDKIPEVYPRVQRWYIDGLGERIKKKFLSKVYRRLTDGQS
jgi:hypothetical protein